MTRAEQRAETERLIRQARYGKRKLPVTKLPCAAREWDSRTFAKRGGQLPGDLDPVKLQLTLSDDEHRENARLDRIARSLQS